MFLYNFDSEENFCGEDFCGNYFLRELFLQIVEKKKQQKLEP